MFEMLGIEEVYTEALKLLMEDRFDAIVEEPYTDPVTKVKKSKKVKIIENGICVLSFSSEASTENEIGYVDYARQDVLTTLPDVKIPIGSIIVVTKAIGKVYRYKLSQQPSMHTTHTRYVLKKSDIG